MKKVKRSTIKKALMWNEMEVVSTKSQLDIVPKNNRWNIWQGICLHLYYTATCELVLGNSQKAKDRFKESALTGKKALELASQQKDSVDTRHIFTTYFIREVIHASLIARDFDLAKDLARNVPNPIEATPEGWEYLGTLRSTILDENITEASPKYYECPDNGVKHFHTNLLGACRSLQKRDQSRFVANLARALDTYKNSILCTTRVPFTKSKHSWICTPVLALQELGWYFRIDSNEINPILVKLQD